MLQCKFAINSLAVQIHNLSPFLLSHLFPAMNSSATQALHRVHPRKSVRNHLNVHEHSTSICELPFDALASIIKHLPRRDHLALLDALPKIRHVLLQLPHSVLTELDLLPTASLGDRPPVYASSQLVSLQHTLYSAATRPSSTYRRPSRYHERVTHRRH